MRYVYLLQSIEIPDQTYVGLTDDLRSRFSDHNQGRSPHTAKFTEVLFNVDMMGCLVIGNIYENPELLKSET
jgi:predicted GIY-YIG superfamily endonuclease